MIVLEGVTKVAGGGPNRRDVLKEVRAELPSNKRVAILASVAEDKKIFLDLLGGLLMPNDGRIINRARVSFPAGHQGGFSLELSVRLNVAHVTRLYGADVDAVVDFVAQVSDLGKAFDRPFRRLSFLQRRYLSEILALSIPFDVYLLEDEIIRPKTGRFNKEARALFDIRAKTSGIFVTADNPAFVTEVCDMGLVLHNGKLRLFDKIHRAIAFSERAAARIDEAKKERKERKRTRRRSVSGN
jgi:capsular polysaccharide transport system ATP-binding protein